MEIRSSLPIILLLLIQINLRLRLLKKTNAIKDAVEVSQTLGLIPSKLQKRIRIRLKT